MHGHDESILWIALLSLLYFSLRYPCNYHLKIEVQDNVLKRKNKRFGKTIALYTRNTTLDYQGKPKGFNSLGCFCTHAGICISLVIWQLLALPKAKIVMT